MPQTLSQPDAQRAEMPNLESQPRGGDHDVNLDVILDVTVTLAMEVDRVFATALPGSHEDVTVRASAGAEVLEG